MTDQQRQQIIDDTMSSSAIERYKEQLHALCRRVEEAVKEDMEEVAHRADGFAEAYTEDIFTPFTKEEIEQHGGIITRASAGMGRHLAGQFKKIAAAIRKGKP